MRKLFHIALFKDGFHNFSVVAMSTHKYPPIYLFLNLKSLIFFRLEGEEKRELRVWRMKAKKREKNLLNDIKMFLRLQEKVTKIVHTNFQPQKCLCA